MAMKLKLEQIRTDGGTQQRAEIHDAAVEEYSLALIAGKLFPPVIVFFDGTDYWLADGFIRCLAYKAAQRETIKADVREGTQRDAILFSCSANSEHGHRRTSADKRKAVQTLLEDEEWGRRSDAWIAEHADVHHSTVAEHRQRIREKNNLRNPQVDSKNEPEKRLGRDGKERTVKPRNPATPKPPEEMVVDSDDFDDSDESDASDEPPVVFDDHGIPVQEHAAESFASVPLFDELLKTLKRCRQLYHELAETPGGVLLLRGSINARDKWKNRGLEDAVLHIEDARPAMTVCPFEYNEVPHPEDCTLCGGRRWTAPFGKGRVPADLVARAKEAFGV